MALGLLIQTQWRNVPPSICLIYLSLPLKDKWVIGLYQRKFWYLSTNLRDLYTFQKSMRKASREVTSNYTLMISVRTRHSVCPVPPGLWITAWGLSTHSAHRYLQSTCVCQALCPPLNALRPLALPLRRNCSWLAPPEWWPKPKILIVFRPSVLRPVLWLQSMKLRKGPPCFLPRREGREDAKGTLFQRTRLNSSSTWQKGLWFLTGAVVGWATVIAVSLEEYVGFSNIMGDFPKSVAKCSFWWRKKRIIPCKPGSHTAEDAVLTGGMLGALPNWPQKKKRKASRDTRPPYGKHCVKWHKCSNSSAQGNKNTLPISEHSMGP